MSWRSRANGSSAWRQCLAPLRQEATTKGSVARENLQAALESLPSTAAEVQDNELAEDLPFLVQQLLGPQPSHGASPSTGVARDSASQVALCRLLTCLTNSRTVSLHSSAANFILGALRQWSDGAPDSPTKIASTRRQNNADNACNAVPTTATGSIGCDSRSGSTCGNAAISADSAGSQSAPHQQPPLSASLPVEAMTALAALLPDHLGMLSEHERAAQIAALMSLLMPQSPQPRGAESQRGRGTAEYLEMQNLALTALASCGGRMASGGSGSNGGLTANEAAALLSTAVSLLQSCACRSRPVEDTAHSRMYSALVRVLQTAIGEARQAWVSRAALLVEGLQRFLTYGVQASVAAAPQPVPSPVAVPPAADGGGGRYRPPHLRRRESQAEGSLAWSDSDMSDTEHGIGGSSVNLGSGSGGAPIVDRFRSSRVRSAVLLCIQTMAKSDPRAMHSYWPALLPLQNPLQPRPLTPHLITVLLYDPLLKVRALAAATVSSLLDGPAQRAILAVAEAKSMSARAPVRGFLTLSLSLGQLLLAAHAGLVHAVATESSTMVLPTVLRALVVLMSASPYERLPPELLPETLKVLRARWGALTTTASPGHAAATANVAASELGPVYSAYLACVAECFSTKHPIGGLAAFLRQQQLQLQSSDCPELRRGGADGCVGSAGSDSTQALVRDLLAVGRDASAAAVLRIEALAALKGLAGNYTTTLPPDVWDDLRATAAMGLSCASAPKPPGLRSGPLSRSSSSSSLGAAATFGLPLRSGDRGAPRALVSHASGPGSCLSAQAAAASVTSSANSSPEDKAAQLSVKLLSDYLSAIARQYDVICTNAGCAGSVDGDGGFPGPPPSPGFLPLAAAVARQQQQQQSGLSPDSVQSEEEREAGMQMLASMWRDAVAALVPAATSHQSYMVRSAGLACLGEVPEPVFSSLEPHLQQQLLVLLSDAAASDAVPAVRAAACKALGAAAVFPAVLAQSQLSDHVTCALLPCLRDSVLSVRIAASWAVANLCDAYRRQLEASAGGSNERPDAKLRQEMIDLRAESHVHASTSPCDGGNCHDPVVLSPYRNGIAWTGEGGTLPLEAHHYRQLAALCGAAINATQDADKVRSNGVRAVGNLLVFLTPDMASDLASAGRCSSGAAITACPEALENSGSRSEPPWRSGERDALSAAAGGWGGRPIGGRNPSEQVTDVRNTIQGHAYVSHGKGVQGKSTSTGGGSSCDGMELEVWLEGALTCLQSTLTTGSMKVQWNACCAAHGLLRNPQLLAHPRVAARVSPLLLLLVMLVRESANFKIRTHAAAALAALPNRDSYGDVLPDALLVVVGALESIANGGGGTAATGAAKPTGVSAEHGEAEGNGDGDGGEGRFPNYRYLVGLSTQLHATLLHLLALVQPTDARRVREALVRRADFLHSCLREQLAEAVLPLRSLPAATQDSDTAIISDLSRRDSGADSRGSKNRCNISDLQAASGMASGGGRASRTIVEVDLPADPFGLSGRRGVTNGGVSAPGGLVGLLVDLRLGDGHPECVKLARSNAEGPDTTNAVGATGSIRSDNAAFNGDGCGGNSTVGGGEEVELLQVQSRVGTIVAPLRGFAILLAQIGPPGDLVLRDVQQALALLQPL